MKLICYFLLSLPSMNQLTLKIVAKLTGGMSKSKVLRQFYKDKRNVEIGMYSYGGCFNRDFNIYGKVKIGRYCSFSKNCRYFSFDHPKDEAIMTPYFYSKTYGLDVKFVKKESIEFGNDVWVGENVIFTSKCKKVGNGAVIGAGAIVNKDVEPYSVVVGVPAKHIRYRFDKETIKLMELSKWWELTPNELYKYYPYRKNPKKFASEIIKDKI